MPLRYTGECEGVHWAVWEIVEDESDLWKAAALSPEEADRLASIKHPRRRIESLAARAARRALPARDFSSLSHSYPWAAAAVAPFPVGIDLERWRPFPPAVWDYFTQESDRELFLSSNFTEWHFWCAKELSYKILHSKYDSISFRRELRFLGDLVEFRRAGHRQHIQIRFVRMPEWLLGIGWIARESVA